MAAALATELEAAAESTRQPACADAHTLHADALAAAPELLRAMREFVEDAGGIFEMPPPIGEVLLGLRILRHGQRPIAVGKSNGSSFTIG